MFDFYLPAYNAAIECDGGYWHADPRFYPDRDSLDSVQREGVERDARKNLAVRRAGLRLLRYWEHDITTRPDWIRRRLVRALGI